MGDQSKHDNIPATASRTRQAGGALRDIALGLGVVLSILLTVTRPIRSQTWRAISNLRYWKTAVLHGCSIGFAGLILLLSGIFILAAAYTPAPDTDFWSINRPPSIIVLDAEGTAIGTRGSHYGDPLPVDKFPEYLVGAFVSTEDRRFYRHPGVDLRGILRAGLVNIKSGRLRQGGSTITQQLARNLFLSHDRTLKRKLQEMHLAFWLEGHLSKDEILSLYLNRTYLGAGTYGVKAASEVYFGKDVTELTLPEAALLAGLPKAPSTLSPLVNFDGATTRALEVIDNLVETKKLDRTTAEIAKQASLELRTDTAHEEYGYFIDFILARTADHLGDISNDIVVRTTLDSRAQNAAIASVRTSMTNGADEFAAEQAALIAYGKAGDIVAMVGGVSYTESQFNRATQAKRQPGSAFKPFVFLAALENGISPNTLFIDQPVEVSNWRPDNYSDKFAGPIRATDAFAKSSNSVAVQASEAIGREHVAAAAQRLGITSPLQEHPSLALGAMEVTLQELTASYLPFPRRGLSASPYAITKIENRQGELLFEHNPQAQTQLFDVGVSRDMNRLLSNVVNSGTGRRARLGRRDVAGKTGTTNDSRDAWFVGFTDQYTAGVWVGNDDNRPMEQVTGGTLPVMIWHGFMEELHDGKDMISLPGAGLSTGTTDPIRIAEYYGALREDFGSITNSGYSLSTTMTASETDIVSASAYPEAEESPAENAKNQRQKPRWWWPFRRRD